MDNSHSKAARLLAAYSDAPISIPGVVKEVAERELGDSLIFYALSDLDPHFNFCHVWVVMGRWAVVFIRESDEGVSPVVRVTREAIQRIGAVSGLSCTTLSLIGKGGETLATCRYTRRQSAAFDLLREMIENGEVDSGDEDTADSAYLESAVAPITGAQMGVAATGLQVVGRLLKYLKPYRKQVAVGLSAAVFVALIGLAPPFLSGRLIDTILGNGTGSELLQDAWFLVGMITAAVIVRAVFLWLRLHLMSVLGEKVARDLRRDVYGHVQNLSASYFSKSQTGTIVSRISSDTDRIWEFITFGVAEAVLSAFTLISIGTVLLMMDWRLGVVMVAPLPIVLLAVIRNGKGMQSGFTKAWRRWADLNVVVADTIPGIRVVKGFAQEDRERARFERENQAVYETFNKVHGNWTRFWPLMMLALHGIGLAVYWFALPRIEGSGAPLSPGTFVSFLLFSWMFIQPVEAFAQMGRMVNRSLSSARRVFELLDTVPEGTAAIDDPVRPQFKGEIEFSDVWFGYQKSRPVLREISFCARKGEVIAVVGRSGAGKSTLVQLLPLFFAPDRGRITVDGVDLGDCNVRFLRQQIGMVDQDPFLFHGSILENIRYGNPGANLEEVIEVARVADCHAFVARLPLGYETEVGERGHTLSGGERQRISLARALLVRPKILLLDEATGNVDGESEARIYKALRESTTCTTLLVAHRLSALKNVDRILVLDAGEIVEQGSYSELAKSAGVFRQIFRSQLVEKKKEKEKERGAP